MGVLLQSRARLLFLGCMILAGYFVYTAVVGELHNRQLRTESAQALQQKDDLAQKEVYLQAVKQYVASDAYVEQEARWSAKVSAHFGYLETEYSFNVAEANARSVWETFVRYESPILAVKVAQARRDHLKSLEPACKPEPQPVSAP